MAEPPSPDRLTDQFFADEVFPREIAYIAKRRRAAGLEVPPRLVDIEKEIDRRDSGTRPTVENGLVVWPSPAVASDRPRSTSVFSRRSTNGASLSTSGGRPC